MADTQLQRATTFAIKQETTVGTLVAPDGGSQFIPLRSGGFGMNPNLEVLESDELVNDIGKTKGAVGKESPEGNHSIYIKHSEVEGQEPEVGLFYYSAFGAKTVNATEYSTSGSSSAGTSSARASLEMGSNEEDNFEIGQAVLIKDATNGYSIRNVHTVNSAGDQLDLNFNLANAPATATALGKAVLYKPAATGHPSFSAWQYIAGSAGIQAIAGCRTSNISATYTAGQFAEAEFSYGGSSYYFNPVVITASNNTIAYTDDGGSDTFDITVGVYKSPIAFAAAVQSQFDADSEDTITVTYDSATGKYTVASDGTTFELNSGDGLATLGFSGAKTGATSYVSDNAITLSSALTASYDSADNIVVKNAELYIGDFSDYLCREAQEVTWTIDTPLTDVDEICAESGLKEKLILERTVNATATLILPKYESHLFDKFINNTGTSAMINIGQKDSAGNWVPGKCVNVCFLNATITNHTVEGDDIVILNIGLQGYIDGTRKDVYLNFI